MASSKKSTTKQDAVLDRLEGLARDADAAAALFEANQAKLDDKARQPGRFRTAPEDNLGLRIQESRRSKNLTQGDLSDLTKSLDADEKGISRAVLSLYESGTNRPSPREIRLLCEALTITPNYLIYGDNAPFHESNDYQRYGLLYRSTPESYAWMAFVLASSHLNHSEAAMRLLLDLARATNKKFDQGIQEKANQMLLDMADQLRNKPATPKTKT